jgi:hypothetical protein
LLASLPKKQHTTPFAKTFLLTSVAASDIIQEMAMEFAKTAPFPRADDSYSQYK